MIVWYGFRLYVYGFPYLRANAELYVCYDQSTHIESCVILKCKVDI